MMMTDERRNLQRSTQVIKQGPQSRIAHRAQKVLTQWPLELGTLRLPGAELKGALAAKFKFKFYCQCPLAVLSVAAEYPIQGNTVLTAFEPDGQPLATMNEKF